MQKSEMAYQTIKARIISATYTSGYRLVVADLADEFGVSALPVRSALARLEGEGMVATRRNIGAQVVGVDHDRVRDELGTVAYLEGLAASLSFATKTDADIAHAESINQAMASALERRELWKLADLNQSFHESLCLPCSNARLEVLLREEWNWSNAVMRAGYDLLPEVAGKGIQEHMELIDLLRSGPTSLDVELAMRAHRLGNIDVFNALERRDSSFRG